jgi:hypothetical protein
MSEKKCSDFVNEYDTKQQDLLEKMAMTLIKGQNGQPNKHQSNAAVFEKKKDEITAKRFDYLKSFESCKSNNNKMKELYDATLLEVNNRGSYTAPTIVTSKGGKRKTNKRKTKMRKSKRRKM